MGYPQLKTEKYCYADYLSWDDTTRYEIIEGFPYSMSPGPNRYHQRISIELCYRIKSYLQGKTCQVYSAPFDVRLAEKEEDELNTSNVVQPDIAVFCDVSKLDKQGAIGAPDWVIEILSVSTHKKDEHDKLKLYERFKVREYWIVNPDTKSIAVYLLKENKFETPQQFYSLDSSIKVSIFPDLSILLKDVFEE